MRETEEELLVSSPPRDIFSLVKLAPSKARTTHLLVSHDQAEQTNPTWEKCAVNPTWENESNI